MVLRQHLFLIGVSMFRHLLHMHQGWLFSFLVITMGYISSNGQNRLSQLYPSSISICLHKQLVPLFLSQRWQKIPLLHHVKQSSKASKSKHVHAGTFQSSNPYMSHCWCGGKLSPHHVWRTARNFAYGYRQNYVSFLTLFSQGLFLVPHLQLSEQYTPIVLQGHLPLRWHVVLHIQ